MYRTAGFVLAVLPLTLLLTGLLTGPLAGPGLAAPNDASVYRKDMKFALDELDDKCGHFFGTKGIRWKKVRTEFTKAAKEVQTDQEQFMLLNRLIARIRDGHARVVVPDTTTGVAWPDRGPFRGPSMFWCVADGKVLVKVDVQVRRGQVGQHARIFDALDEKLHFLRQVADQLDELLRPFLQV